MIFGPTDYRSPNAPVWSGHPGWVVFAVTTDQAAAASHAAEVAAEHRARLAPGTWPIDTPADAQRIAVGPVYVAVRTREGHENGAPLATYYVLRRGVADKNAPAPDPTWPVPGDGVPPASSAPVSVHERPAQAPATHWPFVAVGRRRSRAGSKTLGADVITWRGRLGRGTITFSTQPRKIDAHASFMVSANARIHYTTLHPEFVDVLVHHPLGDAERAELAVLAQAQDARPVVVRCVGEPLRGTSGTAAERRTAAVPGGGTAAAPGDAGDA